VAGVRRAAPVILHVIAPLVAGAAIYLLLRAPTLLVFGWVDAAGGEAALRAARGHTLAYARALGDTALFSAPDALWVYALTAAMLLVWRGQPGRARHAWIVSGVLLGAGSELGQLAGVVPGTFDGRDLLVSVGAFALALLLTPTRPTIKRTR